MQYTCDPFVREMQSVSVSLASSQDLSGCGVPAVGDFNRVGYIVTFTYTCRCPNADDIRLTDQAGVDVADIPLLPLESLEYEETCICTRDNPVLRAPSFDELILAMNALLFRSPVPGIITIKNFGLGCPELEQRLFTTTIYLGATGASPECLTPEEFELFGEDYVDSYNSLISENCDPEFRVMLNASFSLDDPDVDLSLCTTRRQLLAEGRELSTRSTTFRGLVSYACTCTEDVLVSDAVGRRHLQSDAVPEQQPTSPTFYSQYCLCQTDVPVRRAPTFDEKKERFNQRLPGLGIPGVLAVTDVGEGCAFPVSSPATSVTLSLGVTGTDPACIGSTGGVESMIENAYDLSIARNCDLLYRDLVGATVTILPADMASCTRRTLEEQRNLQVTVTYTVDVTLTCKCDETGWTMFGSGSDPGGPTGPTGPGGPGGPPGGPGGPPGGPPPGGRTRRNKQTRQNKQTRRLVTTLFIDTCTCIETTPSLDAPSTNAFLQSINNLLASNPISGISSFDTVQEL